ncbi:hypothetical protein E2C01_053291 [Portunus trituberculatus]|uniref:Apolipoprotein D n=1 Tax=Portunus trituberculatus TaxID=210409 RepID=A0A5B7GP36_PORTR|nr:hypothetical protein [Portunus trituberculatus]
MELYTGFSCKLSYPYAQFTSNIATVTINRCSINTAETIYFFHYLGRRPYDDRPQPRPSPPQRHSRGVARQAGWLAEGWVGERASRSVMVVRHEVVSLVVVEVVVMNILATLTKLSCGHAIEFGRCSSVSGDPYFHPDELEGLWYVIEMYKTSSRCMTITFQRTLDGFTGTEVRELLVGRRVGLDHSVSNTGVFTFKNIDNPALMKVRWPSVFIDKPADVTVVDTDGVHFAVLYECQSLWVLRRASAVILSRQPFLDEAVLQRVRC